MADDVQDRTVTVPAPAPDLLDHIEACIGAAASEFGDEPEDDAARAWLAKVREALGR